MATLDFNRMYDYTAKAPDGQGISYRGGYAESDNAALALLKEHPLVPGEIVTVVGGPDPIYRYQVIHRHYRSGRVGIALKKLPTYSTAARA